MYRMNGCLVTQYVHMTHFLAKELALKSEVSIPWQGYVPLKKITLWSEFADMYVEESEVYFIILLSLIHRSRHGKESPDIFTSLVTCYHNRDMTYLEGINQSWHSKYYKQSWYFKKDIDLWMWRCHAIYTDNQQVTNGLLCGSDGEQSACNAGDSGHIPGSGRSPREENGNPLQFSCLENPIDRGYNPWGCKESDTTECLTQQIWPLTWLTYRGYSEWV